MRKHTSGGNNLAAGIVIAVWGVGIIFTLTLWGTIIWGAIRLIQHITG